MTPDAPHIDEKILFARIAEGEEDAFRTLYSLYGRLLFPFLLKLTRSETLTEDLIQETMLRVWLRRDRLPGIDHPRAWIFRIASNIALDWLQRESSREKALQYAGPTQETSSDDPHGSLTVRAIRAVVLEALSEMPERRRLIYRLHREEGLPTTEIAERLGISNSTVKNTLIAASRFIRERVELAGYTLPLWLLLMLV